MADMICHKVYEFLMSNLNIYTYEGRFCGRPMENREFKFDFQYQYRYRCFHFRSHFGTGNFKALSYHDR
jgi:hypothetical protein